MKIMKTDKRTLDQLIINVVLISPAQMAHNLVKLLS